jgi:rubrerythrin
MKLLQSILGLAIISLIAFTGCNQPKPENTIKNLKEGIKGETTASAKYKAFAERAREDGYDTIAVLFEAASKAESIHAANHKKVLEELGETMEDFTPEFEVKATDKNLQNAKDGEYYEITTMYPKFLSEAKEEKVAKAEKTFNWALDTEKKHYDFYSKALEAVNMDSLANLPVTFAVCPVCGNTYDGASVDEKCAFCQTGKEKFIMFKIVS